MTSACTPTGQLDTALTSAASLLTAAVLADATGGTAHQQITIYQQQISVQVCQHAGDPATRAKVVATYAHVLHTPVVRESAASGTWIATRGHIGAHPVHVWTLIHPDEEA
jgi:hypothetical protein